MTRFDDESEIHLEEQNEPVYSVELHPDGEMLTVTFHSALEDDHQLKCDEWTWLNPSFATAFAHAFAAANLSNVPLTRKANRDCLDDGFIYWIKQNYGKHEIGFPNFAVELFDEFDKWLAWKDEAGSYFLSTSTARHRRSALNGVIDGLKAGNWSHHVSEQCRLRKDPFANKGNQARNVEPYDIHTFCRILNAVKAEAKGSLRHLKTRGRLLARGRALLARIESQHAGDWGVSDEASKGLLMVRLQEHFGPIMPPLKVVEEQQPELYNELQDWGATSIYAALHPSHGDLLPFAYQLSILTAFNPTALLSLQLESGVRVVNVLGSKRVVITTYKGRKRQFVTASFLDTDRELSAPFIVKAVQTWTQDIRSAAPASIRDDFWLYVPRHNSRDRSVRSMRLKEHDGVNYDVNNAITAFQQSYKLPRVSFTRIRATVAVLAQDLFGGDLRAVMDFLQHASPEVTLKNYTSGVAKARHQEVICNVQQLRERWVESNGTLDPRILGETGDPSATTPGWQCADPYNSPVPGQKPGRLCSAYGSCATCPLARVNLNSAVCFARIDQVRKALESAKQRVLPERWAQGLAPLHRAITEFWLRGFSEHVAQEARRISLKPIVPFD